ncbi:MAG: AMP-binding protein [bacterium]
MELFCIKDLPKMSAERFGDKTAMQIKKAGEFREYSFNDIEEQSNALAEYLMANRIKGGKAFAVLGENRPEWGISYFAIAKTGAYIIPVDSMQKEREVKTALHFSQAKGIFVSSAYLDVIKEIKDQLPHLKYVISMDSTEHPYEVSFNEALEEGRRIVASGKRRTEGVRCGLDDEYVIIFTSGTTGTSKGVMLTNRNVSYDIINSETLIGVEENDKFISLLPLHHTFEATAGFLLPFTFGNTITYARSLKSKEIVEDIADSGTTIMLGVPLLFEKIIKGIMRAIRQSPVKRTLIGSMLGIEKGTKKVLGMKLGSSLFSSLREKAGLGTVRLMISGGAALKPDIAEAFESFGFTLFQGYGLTETSPIASINPVDNYKHDSIGVPIPGVEIEIDSPNENGHGELKIWGPIIMKGYYKNQKATDDVIKDSWFFTGDIGYKDEDGFLYISGRKKALIVTEAGKNVYPEEIEERLAESDYIEEALVLPFENVSTKREEVGAIIYPNPDIIERFMKECSEEEADSKLKKIIKKEINKLSRDFAPYKRVKHFNLRYEEFPKTTTKKIKRYLFNSLAIDD